MPEDEVLELDQPQTDTEPAEPREEPTEDEEPRLPLEEQKVPLSRLNEVTAKRRQAEEDAAYWRGVAEGRIAPQRAAQPPQEPQPPKLDQFENYDQYVSALASYESRKATAEVVRQVLSERDQQTAVTQLGEIAAMKMADGAKKFPNLQAEIDQSDLSNDAYSIIVNSSLESDAFADIMHHFATNPAELARVSRLPAGQQLRELGRLEARFETASAPANGQPTTRKVSNAPEPPRSVVGGSSGGSTDPDSMTTDEWIKKREKEVRKQASQGR